MNIPVYLSKEGKVSGPFEPTQIEELKRSGKFYSYEWMWDGQSPEWAPVPRKPSAPPELPAEKTKTITKISVGEATMPGVPAKTAQVKSADIKASTKTFCAVLFDSRVTLGGEVTHAHSRGAKFTSTPTQGIPVSKGTKAMIDLLDEGSDRSAKIQANISAVSRMGDRWVLELEWANCPLL